AKSKALPDESAAEAETADGDVESTPAPAKPVPKPGAGGRPSVADILAAARGGSDGGAAPAAKPAAKKEKPAGVATVAKEKPSSKPAPAQKAEPLDTQSILVAARKSKQPGPMTKAEAAAKVSPAPPGAKKSKEAIVVPPMPKRPDYLKPAPAAREKTADEAASRRSFLFGLSALAVGFVGLAFTSVVWGLATVRFMFPNVLREPPSRFKIGFPDQFPPEYVENKFKAQFGIWVVNTSYNGEPQIFALRTVCTHLGCTPNWLEAEQKFKCPCHGSGFYKDGINFEGPAPRPLERYAISIGDDGQLEVDKSRLFQEELGQWNEPASFVPV
ncbi:MAG: Rieske 2Fe-2S domain-containing protein, partial [Pirellulaceae bacterium]